MKFVNEVKPADEEVEGSVELRQSPILYVVAFVEVNNIVNRNSETHVLINRNFQIISKFLAKTKS